MAVTAQRTAAQPSPASTLRPARALVCAWRVLGRDRRSRHPCGCHAACAAGSRRHLGVGRERLAACTVVLETADARRWYTLTKSQCSLVPGGRMRPPMDPSPPGHARTWHHYHAARPLYLTICRTSYESYTVRRAAVLASAHLSHCHSLMNHSSTGAGAVAAAASPTGGSEAAAGVSGAGVAALALVGASDARLPLVACCERRVTSCTSSSRPTTSVSLPMAWAYVISPARYFELVVVI